MKNNKAMKQINILLIVIIASFSLISCSGFLDQAPNSEETKEYIFEDYTRAQRYLDMLYYYMPPKWTGDGKFGSSYYGLLESATDMSEYSSTYGATNRGFNSGNWKHASVSNEIDRWNSSYNQIRRCFMFLENIDNFNNEPEGRKETMKGEVYFFIAFYYNELLKRYGGVPIVENVLSLEDDLKIPRATYDQTSEFIIKYLDMAYNVVPNQWDMDNIGRVDKAWVLALKSEVLLYAASPLNNPENDLQKWIKAANASRDLIDFSNSYKTYSLYNDWQNIFMRDYPDKRPEIIIYKRTGSNVVTFNSRLISGQQATPGEGFWGAGSNNPTQNFVDRFEVIKYDTDGNAIGTEKFDWNNPDHVKNIYKNRDPRFYYTVLYNNRYWIKRTIATWRDGSTYGADIDPKNSNFSRTGYYLRKFWPRDCYDSKNPGSGQVSSFFIRLGEIYLNYAEAMNEAYGPYSDGLGREQSITAADAINILRARLVCPATNQISGESDPYYYVKVEREENPDFPILPNGMPSIGTNLDKNSAREKIKNERVIELCFEDHYFYDILRWKDGDKHIAGPIYGIDIVKSGESFSYSRKMIEERTFDASRMYRYPIPQEEVYKLGVEQNPGW